MSKLNNAISFASSLSPNYVGTTYLLPLPPTPYLHQILGPI